MPLSPGLRIGPYEIVGAIGAGGMGEVYRARDTKLHRVVALKIVPAAFAQDPDRLARFQREAQVLASLNHPNIAALYGLEDSGETHALVMELVDGKTLDELRSGAVPLSDALPIARQIAEALEAAHDVGVIHRDLKPANVKVRDDGTVKVLDFGLAKALDSSTLTSSAYGLAGAPTMTSPTMTEIGVILGTAGYMSPEQAKGKPTDRRADIWALGVVLFEMLSGRALYCGETVTETIAHVITQPPAWDALPADTPPPVRRLLRRMLEKDPRNRLQSAGDVRIEIDDYLSRAATDGSATPALAPSKSRIRIAVAAGLLLVGALGGAAIRSAFIPTNLDGANRSPLRVSIAMPPDLRVRGFRITPDGTRLVVRASARDGQRGRPGFRLYVRDFASYEFKPIAGTEGVQAYAVSSDGRWLAGVNRVADAEADRQVMKVPIDGSAPPVVLAHMSAMGVETVAYLDNGDILTIARDGDRQAIVTVPSAGGAPGKPIPIQHDSRWTPRVLGRSLPGGLIFALLDGFGPRGFQTNVSLLDPSTGAMTPVIENAGDPVYVDGHVVFSRDDSLMSVPFDLDRRMTAGEVTALEAGLRGIVGPAPFGLATNGTLAYVPGDSELTRQLVVIEPDGNIKSFIEERRRFAEAPAISPDGRRAAVTVMTPTGTFETWVVDPSRAFLRRTFAPASADVSGAVWSTDNQRLAYYREGNDKDDGVYVQRADAQGQAERLSAVTKNDFLVPTDWLPDESGLLVMLTGPGRNFDVLLLPFPSGGRMQAARPLRATSANETWGAISPNGRWLAYLSDESGRNEFYVASFDKGTVGSPQIVSNGACGRPRWSADSRYLYFCAIPARLMKVEVKSTPTLAFGEPVQIADLATLRIGVSAWDVFADGRILAVQRDEAEDSLPSVNVVLNWGAEFRRRVTGK